MVIFGTGDDKNKVATKLFLPLASLSWDLGFLKKGDYDNVILYSFETTDEETVDIRRCFNDVNHVFAFGRNVANLVMNVNMLYFFGQPCVEQKNKPGSIGTSAKLNDIKDRYEKNRIYKNPKTLQISLGDTLNLYGYLLRMTVSGVNPTNQLCSIGFTFLLDQEA